MRNVIMVVNDSFRADHVASYGLPAPWPRPGHDGEPFITTPNFDRLAATGTLFERAYLTSYPTVPARHDMTTGRIGFPTQGWQPLSSDDVALSETLEAAGVSSQFIFDTTPLGNNSFNFMRGYSGWEWVRGQHSDRFVNDETDVELPAARYKIKSPKGLMPYLRNGAHRRQDRDWMAPRTTDVAVEWLERNAERSNGFFLWVDMWDPHEPFDAPAYDLAAYVDPAYRGDRVIYPRYGRVDYLTEAERNDVRARYAANVRMADRSFGRLLDAVDYLNLADETMIVFTTDHGHLFGEHGLQGKPSGPLGRLYEPTVHIPMIIRQPGLGAGRRVSQLVQHPDLSPTILSYLGIDADVQDGRSLLPLIAGDDAPIRDAAFSGRYSLAVHSVSKNASDGAKEAAEFDGFVGLEAASEPITVTTTRWSLIVPPVGAGQLELYDLASDPQQLEDVVDSQPDVVAELVGLLQRFLIEHGADHYRLAAFDWLHPDAAPVGEPAVAPNRSIFGFRVDGRFYGFLSDSEATVTAEGARVEQLTLQELLDREPNALVSIGDQYYLPSDLLLVTRTEG